MAEGSSFWASRWQHKSQINLGEEKLSWECFLYLPVLPGLAGSSLRMLALQGGEENLPSLLIGEAGIVFPDFLDVFGQC